MGYCLSSSIDLITKKQERVKKTCRQKHNYTNDKTFPSQFLVLHSVVTRILRVESERVLCAIE